MQPPQLNRKDVQLRHLRPEDAESWLTYLLDPAVVERTSYDVKTLADVTPMLTACIARAQAGELPRWAIARQTDDTLIGTCGFHSWSAKDLRAELGYDLSRGYWGQGIATAAVAATLLEAFSATNLHRAEAVARVDNVASQRVLEKTGFVREGRLRDFRMCRGVFHDFYMYSRVRDGAG